MSHVIRLKRILIHISTCHAKNTKISIDNLEINEIKKKINDLSSTLSKCAFDKDRLESMFQKKQISKKTTHATRHTHNAPFYTKVYQCTHCDQKDYLGGFCYERMNAINEHNRFRKANLV